MLWVGCVLFRIRYIIFEIQVDACLVCLHNVLFSIIMLDSVLDRQIT